MFRDSRWLLLLPVLAAGCMFHKNQAQSTNIRPESFYRDDASQPTENPVAARVTEEPRTPTAVAPVMSAAAPQPTTAPLAVNTTAQYETLGAIVTEVGGTPIYADKVLQALTPLLQSEARQRDIESYKALARSEIEKQVKVMIGNELEYSAAVQWLSQEDKTTAEHLTEQWRGDQITAAGGSLEIAKQKAAADGYDFDEKVKEQNRYFLVVIYYQRKVYPRTQITAEDMRAYYDQHLKANFTETDKAQFRVIKIQADKLGNGAAGLAAAMDKIKDLRQKALSQSDEEFAKMASEINHDSMLMKSGGRYTPDGWVQKGSLAVDQIEDAVWKLQPGQVSEVIQVGNSFYIARLESRKLGRVRAFEDEDVQKEITETLRAQQVQIQREKMQESLLKDAVIDPYPYSFDTVVEMALQKYPQWASR